MKNIDPILHLFYCLLAFLCLPIGVLLYHIYELDDKDPICYAMRFGIIGWAMIFVIYGFVS